MDKLYVVDLETTGLDPNEGAEIIEIGIAIVDPVAREIRGTRETLVRPLEKIPADTSAVHHIIDADVANAPQWREISDEFRPPDGAIIVAHNAKFERSFLEPLWGVGAHRYVCTYKTSMRGWPDYEKHSNQFLRYAFGLAEIEGFDRQWLNTAHRALPDAVVTAAILLHMLKRVPISRLLEISAEPTFLKRLNFGKHKGAEWKDLEQGYLDWMTKQTDWDEDVAHAVKLEQNRRREVGLQKKALVV